MRLLILKIFTIVSFVTLLTFCVCTNGQAQVAGGGSDKVIDSDMAKPLTVAEANDLALKQASNYSQSKISELILAEDIIQSRASLYPKVTIQPNIVLNTPAFNNLHSPAFLGANGLGEFQGIINAAGEYDFSGKLKATVKRNQALLESARAGSEIARRDLLQEVSVAYYNLAFAVVLRRSAQANLLSSVDFEKYVKLQLDAGEVAPVDMVRARLQTASRRDELEIAKANEAVSADSLRVLIGYDFTQIVATEDLLTQLPNTGDIENISETALQSRPELAQFEAEQSAAEQDIKIAQAERKPAVTYSVSGGFLSDSLMPVPIKNSTGVQASVGISIPIFDRGESKSREIQAKLRLQQVTNSRQLAERQFLQAFFSARTQGISAAARIKEIAASLKDAEANVAGSTARYQAGEAPITEAIDAQNTLISQKQAFYQAIFDYQTARAKLLRAVGR